MTRSRLFRPPRAALLLKRHHRLHRLREHSQSNRCSEKPCPARALTVGVDDCADFFSRICARETNDGAAAKVNDSPVIGENSVQSTTPQDNAMKQQNNSLQRLEKSIGAIGAIIDG